VAVGILENLGYQADLAGDGRDALNALGREDYDLVLMDCQLPDMDGYEATRLIRRPETAVRNHHIPIIAATAHAMVGDREKCLAAGMNGYLSKPLRPEALQQAIEEWTGVLSTAAAPTVPPPVPATTALFDGEDFVEGLLGDRELAQRILRGFVNDMPRQIALLAEAVNASDAGQARLIAHSIKGAAASVCGIEVRDAARKLELTASAGDMAAATAALPGLSESLDRLRTVIESFCHEDPAGPGDRFPRS
jgi:CheY-like chemotaxis protein/HPt (histidine-containing phosphotransfer) domain-containing protein